MKKLIFLFFLIISLVADAQYQKINFFLKADLKKSQSQHKEFALIVRGNVSAIKKEVLRLDGKIGLSAKNIVQVRLKANQIPTFSTKTYVKSIEYTEPKVRVLNDTMKINNNVIPVHNGIAPLTKKYTGKGVIFGLIDAGIDVHHADFRDSTGHTRILRLWDQTKANNGTSTYGYGVVWDSSDINNNLTNHQDPFIYKGHGTHVAGIGAGNGLAVNNYQGVAPEANIVVVAIDFYSSQNTILDAVDYIYKVADSLGMPCVLNISLGDYAGSHDGTDGVAVLIDSLMNYKPGRALVCAAGNEGAVPFHLQQQVNSDTTFTWFKYNPSTILGYGAVFYEIWSDTSDFNNVNYAFGANLPSGSFGLRGKTPFRNIKNRLGNFSDTIINNGNILGIVSTYGELQGDKYLLQVNIQQPDSSGYLFSLMTTGSGKLDVWSSAAGFMLTSAIVTTNLPSSTVYPNIIYYQQPDTAQTIVSSYSCLPSVITVGTYLNRKTYLDVDSVVQVTAGNVGQIDVGSSIGPNRRGVVKPDVASTGRYVMSSTPDTVAKYFIANGGSKWIGFGGKHMLKNGTSMASPVVAGIVALYLEKCPTATMTEIKNAILGSAKQDAFTGVVPNMSYGFGKPDAFAALNTSNFTFTIGTNQNICDGDSVQISAPNYTSYLWNNNLITQNIFVDTSKTIFVTATNSSGCKGLSDTINVIWHALPNKPIITVVGNDTLIYATNLNTQWYYNGNILTGAADTIHIAQNNGNYYVQVSNAFGCTNNSDTVNIILLGIENSIINLASIYPNPTTGKITITLKNNSINAISVVNLLGEVLMTRKLVNQNKLTLNIGNLSEGVYYIRLNTTNKQYLQKLILLR